MTDIVLIGVNEVTIDLAFRFAGIGLSIFTKTFPFRGDYGIEMLVVRALGVIR